VAASVIEETAPLGPVPQGPYLNQMLLLETTLAPAELLRYGQLIEMERGRERGVRWGPRTLDLDIVRFGDRNVQSPGLTIPHPQLDARDFWQRELAELDALLPATHG
jgi:2-amino-4-hydroxy-6-hydroxymethyldihydropteridine diphosphokinase